MEISNIKKGMGGGVGGPELLFEINALNCFGGLKMWGKITIFPGIQYNRKFYS